MRRTTRTRAAKIRRRRLVALAGLCTIVGVTVLVITLACGSPDEDLPPTDLSSSITEQATAVSAFPSTSEPTQSLSSDTATSTASPPTTTATVTTDSLDTSTQSPAAAPVVRHGPKDKKWIALTFDDNYQGSNATKTIAALKKYDVPATFFVIGHYVDLGPDLAREIAAAGFEVGDHTRSHADCASLSKRALRIEIGNGTDHYRDLTGAPTVPLFRPPGGFLDDKTCEVAAEKGFEYVVMWDVDTNDWRGRNAAEIVETVMGNAHNGAIVLMHMAAKHTAEAIPEIVTRLRGAGYELVTLTTMLGV